MTAVDPIVVEVGEAPVSVTVASTGLVLSVATGTVGPAGAQGPTGTNGTNGQGVPVGGTTGQVLAKKTGTNYDTEWVDQTGGGGGGSGTVTSVTGTAPISVATGTSTPVVSIAAATTSAAGSMSASDKSKLDGVASGATANSTDATLLARANHTGVQAATTITGLATVATSGSYTDLSSRPTLGTAAAKDTGTTAGTVAAGDDSRITGAAQKASNLSDLASTSTARTNLGLGGAATLNVGTTASTVAAGDDSRITGAAQKASNLSDLASASTARTNLGLGSLATLSTITSSEIADGTIVNADISASAAIATSKISGLATVATSGSASDLSTGTVASARLSTKAVGGQGAGSTVTEPTTATSLLTSTITIPACAAGDVLIVDAGINFTQNATSKTYTFALKLGATTMLSVQPTISQSATSRVLHLHAVIRVLSTTSQAGAMTVVFNTTASAATAVPYAATGTAAETISSGSLTLDLLATTSASGTTQTLTLGSISVNKVAA